MQTQKPLWNDAENETLDLWATKLLGTKLKINNKIYKFTKAYWNKVEYETPQGQNYKSFDGVSLKMHDFPCSKSCRSPYFYKITHISIFEASKKLIFLPTPATWWPTEINSDCAEKFSFCCLLKDGNRESLDIRACTTIDCHTYQPNVKLRLRNEWISLNEGITRNHNSPSTSIKSAILRNRRQTATNEQCSTDLIYKNAFINQASFSRDYRWLFGFSLRFIYTSSAALSAYRHENHCAGCFVMAFRNERSNGIRFTEDG